MLIVSILKLDKKYNLANIS
ncbi:hypothetical protein DSL72_009412 [Monilinia vaccinii-corymbosi]|uniref:Uncharacterized protein n=1 Tax=Monilinia vaccinii-corymbosi TaxID=61207 RepID=A0A8A3PPF4_9HELO|nr:hypothetical protein DSL72_009412 [Monilinia vaccinii-corymbosi]